MTEELVKFELQINNAPEEVPAVKERLEESGIWYEICDQGWNGYYGNEKGRCWVILGTRSKADAKKLRKALRCQYQSWNTSRSYYLFLLNPGPMQDRPDRTESVFWYAAAQTGRSRKLASRTYNRLRQGGYLTMDRWQTATDGELLSMRDFGKECLRLVYYARAYLKGETLEKGRIARRIVDNPPIRNAKDKLYYMCRDIQNVGKGDLFHILDVSEMTLKKWAYNPVNVSEEMNGYIRKRLAVLDYLAPKVYLEEGMTTRNSITGKDEQMYRVCMQYHDRIYVTRGGIWRILRNAVDHEFHYGCHTVYGSLSRIADRKDLELEPGMTSWPVKEFAATV